jgi:hypothetical protein
MSPQDKKPTSGNIAHIYTTLGLIFGVISFQVVAPKIFPSSPGSRIDISRSIWAGIFGGGASLIGLGIGTLIERSRK